MSIYDAEQVRKYFDRIDFALTGQIEPSLDFLCMLQRLQLARVPFESLSLHYSTTRSISLDTQALFTKIVVEGRGGYCLENNTFFKAVLQSLGFQVSSVVCRISNASRAIFDGGWRGMSHMANVVNINDRKYLVDVGYGRDGPSRPVPLVPELEVEGLPGQMLKLEHKRLSQHANTDQRVWVYSQLNSGGKWTEVYHFIDVEMFPADFDILNLYNMQHSYFAQHVVAQRFVLDKNSPQKSLVGSILLVRDTLAFYTTEQEATVEHLRTEEERIAALADHFGIHLNTQQREAIYGRNNRLAISHK